MHGTLVHLDATYCSPEPSKNEQIICFPSDYFHILHVVERIALVYFKMSVVVIYYIIKTIFVFNNVHRLLGVYHWKQLQYHFYYG